MGNSKKTDSNGTNPAGRTEGSLKDLNDLLSLSNELESLHQANSTNINAANRQKNGNPTSKECTSELIEKNKRTELAIRDDIQDDAFSRIMVNVEEPRNSVSGGLGNGSNGRNPEKTSFSREGDVTDSMDSQKVGRPVNVSENICDDLTYIKQGINSILFRLNRIENLKTDSMDQPVSQSVMRNKTAAQYNVPVSLGLNNDSSTDGEDSEEIPFLEEDMGGETRELQPIRNDGDFDLASNFKNLESSESVKIEVNNMLSNMKNFPLEKEIHQLGCLVNKVPCLHFLKPRFAELFKRDELNHQVIAAIYRIAARCLSEELEKKEKELRDAVASHERFKKQMTMLNEALQVKSDKPASPENDINVKAMREKVEILEKEFDNKVNEVEKLNTMYERLQTDFNNFRNRQKKEVDRLIVKSKEEIFIDLLKVSDNLERGIEFSRNTQNIEAVVQGLEKIFEQFLDILNKHELIEIPTLGIQFDPNYHEVLAQEESIEHPEGTIIEVLTKGYQLGEKVIRASKVKTSILPQ
jgi:molecular chaperone GrpE